MSRITTAIAAFCLLACLTMLGLTAKGKSEQPRRTGQDFPMPENPLLGRIVFEQKGCITCHAIKGEGGLIGPDLGHRRFYGSFLELAGIMWNHSPEMFRRMRELELPYPELSAAEIGELMAYLYYLRYLGEPGDLYRGKILLKEKECLVCHSIAGKGGNTGPAFDKLGKYVSPIYMAQAMWNHGPEMQELIQQMNMPWPTFQRGEIVDLIAYVREASRTTQQEKVYMSPGNPAKGEVVFKTKGCASCHAATEARRAAPDLGQVKLDLSVTEIAGLMWNHGSKMYEQMAERRIAWPSFTSREMADLIAYIYFLRFIGKAGDATVGQHVFTDKGCVNCHAAKKPGERVGPNLATSRNITSPLVMAQILWNHAPLMEEMITTRHMEWPTLSGEEMANLYVFLRSLPAKAGE